MIASQSISTPNNQFDKEYLFVYIVNMYVAIIQPFINNVMFRL